MKMEYDEYIHKMEILPPKEIIKNAYEIVYKYEILYMFETEDCYYRIYDPVDGQRPYKKLLEMDYPLDYLYQKWIDWDGSVIEELESSIRFALDVERFIPSSLGG